jgi:putative flippase GtrA
MTAARQFFRFGCVGVAGFLVDWAVVSIVLHLGASFYLARAISYLCAATSTWFLNRAWTFSRTDQSAWAQWLAFLAANALGGAINYGVSVLLVTFGGPVMRLHPGLPVAAGSLAGMCINFALSRRFVFRQATPKPQNSGKDTGK